MDSNQTDELFLIETDDEVIVAWSDDAEDWVARFRKDGDFPAHYWASRMLALYGERFSQE